MLSLVKLNGACTLPLPILAIASIPSFDATPHHSDRNLESPATPLRSSESGPRRLQFAGLLPIGLDNTTCPEGCLLCQCNQTDTNCLIEKSMQSCVEKSFDVCYKGIYPGIEVDIGGLCSSQCNKPAEEITQPNARELCSLCKIFTCCEDCPSERANECFFPNITQGYIPRGWEPPTCAGTHLIAGTLSVSLLVFIFGFSM